ncbi:hypothetical protein [Methylobacter sp.]|uniref:hypothetical protein n=1 Tax=Methylobacter sp. TaxID=2051955 RepID=UPI00248822EC|nr:hypothetical protein [Methylobacter sp.]MDI1275958.1 hypothetical protein [Methylobacter sp.]MDI1356700.1 hypothetical protein [Methylobacter sp.]
MMSLKFNLSGLKQIYLEALQRSDPTLAFEVVQGLGRFVFMMFFSKEDKESKDRLFVQLRNTQVFLELKVYGSHRSGDFFIYFNDCDQEAIINELQLGQGGQRFNFNVFLEQINQQIPATLPLQVKLDKIREVWPQVRDNLSKVVDQADKTILMGIKSLPVGKKPQDKTLRKLYVYTNGEADVITNLIAALKQARVTLAWTNKENVVEKSLAEIMRLINA